MKGSKSLLLLASLLVGLGSVTTAKAQNAQFQSLSISSPDSGSVRGIDSTFVVQASIVELSKTDSLEVHMWLITGAVSGGAVTGVSDAAGQI